MSGPGSKPKHGRPPGRTVQFVPTDEGSVFAGHNPFFAVLKTTDNPRVLKLVRSNRPGEPVRVRIGHKLLARIEELAKDPRRPVTIEIRRKRKAARSAGAPLSSSMSGRPGLSFHPDELSSIVDELLQKTKEATDLILSCATPQERAFVSECGGRAARALRTIDHGMDQRLPDEIRRGLTNLIQNLNDLRRVADDEERSGRRE